MTQPEAEGVPAEGEPMPAAPTQPSPWEGFEWDGNVDSLPPPVAKVIRDARKDSASARTTAKATAAQDARNELVSQFAEVLGLAKGEGDAPPDPKALTEHLQRAQSENVQTQLELRVYKAAGKVGIGAADVERLLDSRAFSEEIDNLDVSNLAEFDTAVTELIKGRMANQPQATATTGRTPVEALRPGALPNVPPPSLDEQIAAAQKAGNYRQVISLQNQKLANLTT